MSLRHKILLFIAISGLLLTGALYFILSDIFSKSFKKLEFNYVESEVLSVLDSFSGVMDELKGKSANWAIWDDSYNFVQTKDAQFIKSNLTDNTFMDLRLNHIIIINNQGEFVYRHAHDLQAAKEVPFPGSLEKILRPGSSLLKHNEVDSVQAGVLALPEGILLLVSRPIVTSLKKGPIRGTIIFARYLEDEQIQQMNRMTQHVLSVRRYDDPELPSDFQNAKDIIFKGQPVYVQTLSENVIAGYCVVNDIFASPVLIIRMDQPRSIYRQGLLTLRYLVLSVVLMSLVSVIVILFLLEKLILLRLEVMNNEVREIAAKNNLSGRLSEMGKDELGMFANTLNKTLEQLEQVQLEIKNSEEWFRILFEYAPDAIFLNSPSYLLVDANRKTLSLLGKTKEEVIGKSLNELHLMIVEDFSENRKKDSARDLFFSPPASAPMILEIQTFPITFKGQHLTLNIARDITERKSLEKMKEEFIFTVLHELRTHLSIVKAFLGNLQAGTAGSINEQHESFMDTSVRNVNRRPRLINDLLDFSRLESGKARMNRRASLLPPLFQETLDNFQERAKSHHLQLIKNIPETLPVLYVDPDMIVQVVFNLLDNAFRFAKTQVKLDLLLHGHEIEVIVSNDGEGISKEGLLLLFNKFQQIDRPSGGAGYKGTGLGLVICKEIIRLHQGRIWAESEEGHGARFHFTLPLAPSPIKRENN